MKVRIEVSFELPKQMSKAMAASMVRQAIEHWAAGNPSQNLKTETLKMQRFAVS